jgi:hypothetical protein
VPVLRQDRRNPGGTPGFIRIRPTDVSRPARAERTGAFSGVIIDAQSGVLPGVALTLINTETGAVRTLATDAGGT